MKNIILTGLIGLIILGSCSKPQELNYFKLSGFAQGTSYHVTYGSPDSVNYKQSIDSLLRDFDRSLSTYDSSSLISRINRNEDLKVDDKIRTVYKVAEEVNKQSDGAFDLTVMPLVNAWGFGPGKKADIDQEIIDSILNFVGMEKIRIEGDQLVKENPGVSIDVNAIAQGYSVDILASFLASKGIDNYMVEVGGEVKTRGKNPNSEIWKIGIDRPEYGNLIPGLNMQAIIQLNEKALATSGNYRKFYEEDGVKYAHSIDPVTGYPAKHQLLSATIVAESCIVADAIATACMVVGLEKAKEILSGDESLDGYLIYGDEEGKYQVWTTAGFDRYILNEAEDTQREN